MSEQRAVEFTQQVNFFWLSSELFLKCGGGRKMGGAFEKIECTLSEGKKRTVYTI